MENYISGQWQPSAASDTLLVLNPATGDELDRTPLSTGADVATAVEAAARAFPAWRRVPVTDRVQFLFKLKPMLEHAFEHFAAGLKLNSVIRKKAVQHGLRLRFEQCLHKVVVRECIRFVGSDSPP